jgi:hypothetical protein
VPPVKSNRLAVMRQKICHDAKDDYQKNQKTDDAASAPSFWNDWTKYHSNPSTWPGGQENRVVDEFVVFPPQMAKKGATTLETAHHGRLHWHKPSASSTRRVLRSEMFLRR